MGKIETPWFEVADVIANYGKQYRLNHPVSFAQYRILIDIGWCRTVHMGGHSSRCDRCDYIDISYNSCRNRHCPKCGALNKARWLEARQNDLLPAKYFHVVFTLPHELNPLIMANRKQLLDALFRVVRNTLSSFCLNPRYGLKGQLGYTAVLHTWDQKLNPHYHLHLIVPAGVFQPVQSGG